MNFIATSCGSFISFNINVDYMIVLLSCFDKVDILVIKTAEVRLLLPNFRYVCLCKIISSTQYFFTYNFKNLEIFASVSLRAGTKGRRSTFLMVPWRARVHFTPEGLPSTKRSL